MNDSMREPSGGRHEGVTEALLEEIDAATHRMGRLMAARHARFQHATGMPTPQYMVLKMIACEGPMRVSDLASILGVKNPAASMLTQQLEQEGLVARKHDAADSRVVIVSLTEEGARRLGESEVYRRDLLRRMTADLSTDELADLARILGKLNDTVARDI